MNVNKNARLTPRGRERMIELSASGFNVVEGICRFDGFRAQ
jgi:hypothetical protein